MSTTFPSAASTASERAPGRPLSRLLIAVLVALPFVLITSWSKSVVIWQTGSFFDSDDAARAVEVRDWMAGQGWFDLAAHRLGPPEGLLMHWSRVVDVPLALLNRTFEVWLAPDMAERATRILYPLALQVGLVAAMAHAGRVLAGRDAVWPAALLIVFGGIAFTQFMPGRIDHEGLQILLLMVMVASLLDALDPARAGQATIAGLLVPLSLAISLENLPFIAVLLAVLPVLWIFGGQRYRGALLGLGSGLGVAAPALFLATVPPSRYGVTSLDAYSAPHLAAVLMAAAICCVLALVDPCRGAPGRLGAIRRAALLAGLGLAAAAALVVAFPDCLRGPFADLDPLVKRLWLDHVREVQPLLDALRERPGTTVLLVGPVLVASVGLAAALSASRGLARLRWAVLAAFVAVGFAGALWGIRVAFALQPLALLGGAWAVGRSLAWARVRRMPLLATAVPFAIFLACSSLGWAFLPLGPGSPADVAADDQDQRCLSAAAFAPLGRLPPGRVFAALDTGPFLMAHTPLSVVAGPFHRNNVGNHAVLEGLTAPPEAARAIVEATGARYVMVCPREPQPHGTRNAPDTLLSALDAGRPPAWLKPIPVDGTPYRVFAVE